MELKQALQADFTGLEGEVWGYPLTSINGPFARPSRQASIEQIEKELGSKILATALFIDIDDEEAHKEKRATDEQWWSSVESALAPLRGLAGWFQYRTTRGARCGAIFTNPQEIEETQDAKRELYAQVGARLAGVAGADVDEACKDISRGFALPHINKRGAPISRDLARVWISGSSMDDNLFSQLAELGKKRGEKTPNSGPVGPVKTNEGPRATPNGKSRIIIPARVELDGPEAYNTSRSMIWKLSRLIHHEGVRADLIASIDRHIMSGRRAEKEPKWAEKELELLRGAIPPQDADAPTDAPPEPAPIVEHPRLRPMRRIFERGDDLDLAEAILECFGDDPAPLWHGDSLRHYDPATGAWELFSRHALRRVALHSAGAVNVRSDPPKPVAVTHAKIKASLELIASICHADARSAFDLAPAGVCLDGSFISVANDRLIREDLDPKWRAIHALPYSIPSEVLKHWESGGESGGEPERPRIFCDVFLGASLSRPANEGETERDVEREINAKIETIAEWLGLALLGLCTREATALVVFGKGSNGKSVLTSLVADLFGADRTCHIPPQQMAERFSRAQLFGRAINVVSEMPESELLASDTLKAIISGDSIEVERKHQDPFSFSPRAGHIFACNTLPSSRDRSWGLWRRLVPIEFHRVFGRSDRDPRLLEKLRDEYDLLVPWALEHARLYLLRGGYAHIERINEYRHEWRSSTDSICAFVESQTEPAELTDGAELKEIWKAFREWAEDVGQSGSAKMSLNAFSRALCALPSIEKKRTGRDRKTKINRNLINERIKTWT